ncbi:MAG: hypothetical protein KA715_10535 [Xanthomonadaceae bacterium]|nr:hypothetical protein [Xanthomonadaceae bacterium]
MNKLKIKSLLDLFQVEMAPCVSIYIPKISMNDDVAQEKEVLDSLLKTVRKKLLLSMSDQDASVFLKRVSQYQFADFAFNSKAVSVALFCSENFFWSLPIGVHTLPTAIVAKSFHIKPVVRWAEIEKKHFLLRFDRSSIKLYRGRLNGLKLIAEVSHFNQVEDLLNRKVKDPESMLIVSARKDVIENQIIAHILKSKKVVVLSEFAEDQSDLQLQLECRRFLLRSIQEEDLIKVRDILTVGKKQNRLINNINEIAEFAVRGQIECLVVSQDDHVWAEVSQRTGEVKKHSFSEFLRSDDLLDDLVEIVGRSGGEVRIVPRSRMPKGEIAIALLKESSQLQSIKVFYERNLTRSA